MRTQRVKILSEKILFLLTCVLLFFVFFCKKHLLLDEQYKNRNAPLENISTNCGISGQEQKKISSWFFLAVTHDLLWAYYSASPTFFIAPLGRCFAQLACSDEMKSDTKIK